VKPIQRAVVLAGAAWCAWVIGPAAPAWGQTSRDRASLSGTIRDATGGVLPGATIAITNAATGAVREGVADEAGVYHAAALTPGTYEVRIALDGFTTKVFPAVVLTVGQQAELDAQLEVAPTSASVVVQGGTRLVETTRVAQASTLSQLEIDGLPINQRSFLDFALLTPGVTSTNPLATPTPTNSPTSGLSFSGQDQRSNDVTIDGADNMDAAVNSVRSTLSQDAVQEFQVLRSNFSAEFGRARGGVVNIVSKSGTNVHHGGGFLYARDDALDARNAFAVAPDGTPTHPPFSRQQYGGTWGGPLIRNRAFFFASVEELRRRESVFVSVLQSDQALRATASQQRLFGALAASGDPALAFLAAVFTHPTFGVLNTTRSTFPGTVSLLERESGTFPFASDSHTASVRLDVPRSATHQITGRVNVNDATTDGNDVGGLRGVSSGTRSTTRNVSAVASNTQVLSARSVNIIRGQYGHFHTAVLPTDPTGPGLVIGGVAQVGRDLFNPTDYAWNIAQVGNTFFHSRGRHQLKAGGDLLHMRSRDARAEVFLAGQFQFAEAIPLAAVLDGALGPGTTAGLAGRLASPASAGGIGRPDLLPDLLAPVTSLQSYNFGLPVVYLQGFGDPTTDISYTQLGAFVQDEVRLGSRATLSAGLRYDTDWRDPSVNVASTSAPFALGRSVITDRNNFAPRLGVAYALGADHQSVLRGGWGLFYQNALQVSGFTTRVLSGQISQVFLPLTGIPGVNGTSADVWQRYQRDGRVDRATLTSLGISPGTTPAVLLVGRDGTPNPVSAQASAGVEHTFASDWAMAADYSYNRGRHILRSRDVNVRGIGPNAFALPGLDPRFLQLSVLEGTGRSEYHGLSLSLRRRHAGRWAMSASYTLGQAMDDVSDFTIETQPDDQTNLAAEWGPSSFDQRHRVVASAVWQSPMGDAVPAWLADWSLAPIVTYASGRPFTPLTGFDANGDSHADTDRARLRSGLPAGRNSGIGPAYFSVDLRLARSVASARRTRVELTLEAFNLFNRVNYSGVNRVFGTQAVPNGTIHGNAQLAPTMPGGFTSALAARQLQVGLRLRF
jgi:outer membrane receptor protein involved in Fe transport